MIRFKRGMTVLVRRKYREQVLAGFLEEAHRKAAEHRLTSKCKQAMAVTGRDPEKARELHAECRAEEPGGPGCLCLCHDVITSGVLSGTH